MISKIKKTAQIGVLMAAILLVLTLGVTPAILKLFVDPKPIFTNMVKQSTKSVVHIKCPQWQGSGFVIDEHIIVTARHVVDDVNNFVITDYTGRQYKSTRAISDKLHDIGFIWVKEKLPDWMSVELGSIKDCLLGQDVYAIGSPYGKANFNSVTKGIISGLDRTFSVIDEDYGWEISFTTDAVGHPGNSGCPVFSLDGKVRGILVGGFSNALIICMPTDIFMNDVDKIKLMFIQDKYQFEKVPKIVDVPYYNEEKNT